MTNKHVNLHLNPSQVTLRLAKGIDAKNIFDLANDPVVRENSFNHADIAWDDHKKWLLEKLNNQNFLLFLGEVDGKFAGQTKFERTSGEVVIGISVAPEFRGRGIATILINKGLNEAKKLWPQISAVNAYIQETNIASIKLFKKCDFRFVKNLTINEHPSVFYQYHY